MFETKKRIAARLADAVDLLIDFATLGEYGLEPAGVPADCERRVRRSPSLEVGFAAVDRRDHLPARL
ncbi:MAG: hypothetical protein U0R52_13895 [Solirubrobacterales bacterium]